MSSNLIENSTFFHVDSGQLCGTSRALFLWVVNFVCLIVHLSMGIAVLARGADCGDRLVVPLTTTVGVWTNRTASGFEQEVATAAFAPRLDHICASFAFISAFFHLVVCCFSRFSWNATHQRLNLRVYYGGLEKCLVWWRWVEYSLSAPVMLFAMMITAGIRDVNTLALACFLMATTMLFGWTTELLANPEEGGDEWREPKAHIRLVPFFFGCFTYVPVWVVFIAQFFTNVDAAVARYADDDRRMPGFVYVIVFSQVAIFSLFTIPILVYQTRPPSHYWETEVWYSFLSLTSKVLLNGLIIANVFMFTA